jgi:bacterioferritin-associated ferredoxin
MIVCSCNVLSDHDVRTAVTAEARPRSPGQVYGCLGCSAQCGRCARTIRNHGRGAGFRGDCLHRLRASADALNPNVILNEGGGCRPLVLAETNPNI